MVSATPQGQIEFFKEVVQTYEPYSPEEYGSMTMFDGESHAGDPRYAANICLQALLDMGYSEDEVNPWKNKRLPDK